MIYKHLKNDIKTVKKYVGNVDKVVWYQDIIQGGYSLKVEYLQKDTVTAVDTYNRLKKRFPENTVRLLKPTPDRRWGGYAVRIWVK